MADSKNSDDFNSYQNLTDNKSNSNETVDQLIEIASASHIKSVSLTDEMNEDNLSLSPDDVDYKLAENCSQRIPPCLLDKFDFRIDSEMNRADENFNQREINNNNNEDDYIDEDLYHISGDDLEPITKKTDPKEDDSINTITRLKQQSVLIPMPENHATKPATSEVSQSPANSEPSAKITKPNEASSICDQSMEKIQLKSAEMIEYIVKKAKQKDKAKAEQKLKPEQKASSLISTYSNEEHSTRKKSHKKSEIHSNKSKTKLTPPLDSTESAFIWTELEAFIKQHEQTGQSSCGASAIINVLKALDFEIDFEKVNSAVRINSRIPENQASCTTLAQYLFSRSVAGMNATEMIENINRATSNIITGRFFPFNLSDSHHMSKWLAHWIRKGAVPVALLNLQKTVIWDSIPDAWHHQMIYAVSFNEVYLTNPLERKPIEVLLRELNSDSVLLVRKEDVFKRFNANPVNLNELLTMKNYSNEEKKRWYDLNVLGQVVNVLRSSSSNITHITIPASYVAGITLFARKDSLLYKEILLEK